MNAYTATRSGAVLYVKDIRRMVAFYAAVLGLEETESDPNHVVLDSPGYQLVILGIPAEIAASIEITTPPARRANAAIKPVFFVESLAVVRQAADMHGGVMNPVEKQWSFQGFTVCDGLDPEGNVLQFREPAASA